MQTFLIKGANFAQLGSVFTYILEVVEDDGAAIGDAVLGTHVLAVVSNSLAGQRVAADGNAVESEARKWK